MISANKFDWLIIQSTGECAWLKILKSKSYRMQFAGIYKWTVNSECKHLLLTFESQRIQRILLNGENICQVPHSEEYRRLSTVSSLGQVYKVTWN